LNSPQINGALLGHGLESKVGSGENAGRTLHHEFVVLTLAQAPLAVRSGVLTAEIELTAPASEKAHAYGAAFWVTDGRSQRPLQTVGGDLD
jgi:hypothetical protein